jgi:hypothetical protein
MQAMASANASHSPHVAARPGDWVEVDVIGGGPPRRGLILEVLRAPSHEDHYRVRWDEQHESIFYPCDSARIVRSRTRRGAVA